VILLLEKTVCSMQTAIMTNKEIVEDLFQRIPDASLQDIAYELEFIAAVQRGVAELDNGQSVSVEEIKRDLSSWLTESDSHLPPGRT
jgi:predicted transcriptional regulator